MLAPVNLSWLQAAGRHENQVGHHFSRDQQDQGGQQDHQLLAAQQPAHARAGLGSHGRTERQGQNQDQIYGLIGGRLHVGDSCAQKEDLKQAGAHRFVRGHAEQVNHHGDHDESAAHAHDGREHADYRR